jgi:hypothetical protein
MQKQNYELDFTGKDIFSVNKIKSLFQNVRDQGAQKF